MIWLAFELIKLKKNYLVPVSWTWSCPAPVSHVFVAVQRQFERYFWISVAKGNPLLGKSWNLMPSDPPFFLSVLVMVWDISRTERAIATILCSAILLSQQKNPWGWSQLACVNDHLAALTCIRGGSASGSGPEWKEVDRWVVAMFVFLPIMVRAVEIYPCF